MHIHKPKAKHISLRKATGLRIFNERIKSAFRAVSDPAMIATVARYRFTPGKSDLPVIFVFGVPRAGTSLVAAILGANSRSAFNGAETCFFLKPNPLGGHWPGLSDACKREIALSSRSLSQCFERFASEYLDRKESAEVFIEKTPGHIAKFPVLKRCFPNARFIFLVRHPGDAFLSWNRHPRLPSSNLERYLSFWNYFVGLYKHYSADITTAIRYEDLCADPDQIIRKLCHSVDLDFEPRMLEQNSIRTSAGSFFLNSGAHERIGVPINSQSVGQWRWALTPSQRALMHEKTKSQLSFWGYGDAPDCTIYE